MPIIKVKDITGGYSALDPETLDDNQFQKLYNFYYDGDKRLITRRGYKKYFDPISDNVVTLDDCNATTGWSVALDGANLVGGSAIRGTASLEFDIDVSANASNTADLIKSTLSSDISDTKGYLGLWLYVPTGFNTNLTDVKVRLGTDSSNYYEWTLDTLTENANNYVKLDYDDATETGTVNDASIAYFRLRISYAAAYTDKANLLVDSIVSYSDTSTEPVQGYYFVYDTANEQKITIAIAGENMFHWNETGWDVIDTGLTKFETATGRTTQRTRWGFFAYNGSGTLEVGMGNGVDDYRTFNGTVVTSHAAQPKCKYFLVLNEEILSTGDPNAPITLYYTGAGPANAQTLNTNDIDIGTEFDGDINGLFPLAETALVGKERKIYYFDSLSPTVLPIDTNQGLYSNRAVANVGNAILYQSANSIENLRQKGATVGTQALTAKSYASELEDRLALIEGEQRNANCGYYINGLNNYYYSFDESNSNKPNATLVYSSLVADSGVGWTEYGYPSIYEYGRYVDSDFNEVFLICSANAGQIYQIETGFTDDGNDIYSEFITKLWNFDKPESWKDIESIALIGTKNLGSTYYLEVIVEGDVVYTAELDDDYIEDTSTSVSTIASDPIGDKAIGGGGSSASTQQSLDLYQYQITLGGTVFAAGRTVKIRGYGGSDELAVFSLDRYQIRYKDNSIDIKPISNFA